MTKARGTALIAAIVAMTVLPNQSLASVAYFVEVTQPIGIEGRIVLGGVGFVRIEPRSPYLEVMLTVEPNCTPSAGESPGNTNLAAASGMAIKVLSRIHQDGSVGDTLRVALDATKVTVGRGLPEGARAALIKATIDAMLANASRAAPRWPQLRYLQITTTGAGSAVTPKVVLRVRPIPQGKDYY
jgi:hypothetical protein